MDEATALPAHVLYPYMAGTQGSDELTQGTIQSMGGQTITPSKTAQTISCTGKYMTGNITVSAIPSNYLDLTGGRVGFSVPSCGGFASPLDGGFLHKASRTPRGDIKNNGLVCWVPAKNNYTDVISKYSVNLTGVNRIRMIGTGTGMTYASASLSLYNLSGTMIRRVTVDQATPTANIWGSSSACSDFRMSVSDLSGHYFVGFTPNSQGNGTNFILYYYAFEV